MRKHNHLVTTIVIIVSNKESSRMLKLVGESVIRNRIFTVSTTLPRRCLLNTK